jgi:hypothetical protein
LTLCGDSNDVNARSAFARIKADATTAELETLQVNAVLRLLVASHPSVSPRRAAELISELTPRSHYVVHRAAQGGYEYDGYDSYYVETEPEQGHHEFADGDAAAGWRLIDALPGRREAVLEHLRTIDPTLHALLSKHQ